MREVRHDQGHRWVTTSAVDEEAIDHDRVIGIVEATGEQALVRVAQRIGYDLLADPIGCRVSSPRITVGGMFEMTADQARELACYLWNAASFAEPAVGVLWSPRPAA